VGGAKLLVVGKPLLAQGHRPAVEGLVGRPGPGQAGVCLQTSNWCERGPYHP
jgi:hypothetical protein